MRINVGSINKPDLPDVLTNVKKLAGKKGSSVTLFFFMVEKMPLIYFSPWKVMCLVVRPKERKKERLRARGYLEKINRFNFFDEPNAPELTGDKSWNIFIYSCGRGQLSRINNKNIATNSGLSNMKSGRWSGQD